ncbi:hypothetical protein ACWEGE_24550 [Amycolatopsis sp. NPDC004747]
MNRFVKRATVVGAVAAGALALAAPAALAAGTSRTCPGSACQTTEVWFPGGTLSVDADVHGRGGAEWAVLNGNGTVCRLGFDAAAGPLSWVCTNVPAQWLYGTVSGPAGPSNIGLRW